MAISVNTNTISLLAQNNLNSSQSKLSQAIERLSSGLSINSASDNAAGQAIANRLESSINGLTQASSNANDGISIAQTTEGALDEINDNLQSIRTLVVQAQNGTNSASDLQSIQDEINERLAEIDRISEQTEFNGVNVLDGSKTSVTLQVGSQDGQTITLDLSEISTSTLGLTNFNVNGPSGTTTAVTLDSSTYDSVTITSVTGTNSATGDASSFIIDETTLVTDENGNYFVSGTYTDEAGDTATGYVALTDNDISIADDGTLTVTIDADAEVISAATTDPLTTLDKAIATVDESRSNLGAVQNRLDSAINNITSTTTNLSEAQSRIQDADYATEVSNMSKAQILQQAGASVLAQANSVPEIALTLLQG